MYVKAKKTVITILIILLLILAIYILLQRPLWTEPEMISTVRDPESSLTVYVYKSRKITRETETYHVSVLSGSRLPSGGGNIYEADIAPNLVAWNHRNYTYRLLINNYTSSGMTPKIYTQRSSIKNIQVKYNNGN